MLAGNSPGIAIIARQETYGRRSLDLLELLDRLQEEPMKITTKIAQMSVRTGVRLNYSLGWDLLLLSIINIGGSSITSPCLHQGNADRRSCTH